MTEDNATAAASCPAGSGNPVPGKIGKWAPWIIVLAGLCVMYIPTLWSLFHGSWSSGEEHGPIVLFVALWLLYRKWPEVMAAREEAPRTVMGWVILPIGLLFYIVGRSQSVVPFEAVSIILILVSLGLGLLGKKAIKLVWFPLFFMLFMVPIPAVVVDSITMPMKIAVSWAVEHLLYSAGYPIARSGVILQIGQYQLLVADACAGLQTLFTLESLGLLYLNLVRHESIMRNTILAILIVPISYTANVIRVMLLVLITYYWGDEVGQGFLHGFAGMVLFLSALILIIGFDSLTRTMFIRKETRVTA
ncbi:MAG: exosortase B [Azoarcus sp.]|jgi:exosortase B|nr:exosortase B [Azoarcus sp.]